MSLSRPSNGDEGYAWQHAWCDTCSRDADEDCTILLTGLCGDQPPEWHLGPPWSRETCIFCTAYEQAPIGTWRNR